MAPKQRRKTLVATKKPGLAGEATGNAADTEGARPGRNALDRFCTVFSKPGSHAANFQRSLRKVLLVEADHLETQQRPEYARIYRVLATIVSNDPEQVAALALSSADFAILSLLYRRLRAKWAAHPKKQEYQQFVWKMLDKFEKEPRLDRGKKNPWGVTHGNGFGDPFRPADRAPEEAKAHDASEASPLAEGEPWSGDRL